MGYYDEYYDIIDGAKYQEGDKVLYRGDYGLGPIEEVIIKHVDEKNGEVVYDLSNDHWCYESQIIRKV